MEKECIAQNVQIQLESKQIISSSTNNNNNNKDSNETKKKRSIHMTAASWVKTENKQLKNMPAIGSTLH